MVDCHDINWSYGTILVCDLFQKEYKSVDQYLKILRALLHT